MVGDAHVETDLLPGPHLGFPGVADHSGPLPAVTLHPSRGGEGAIQKVLLCSITHVLVSTVGCRDKTKLAPSGEPQKPSVTKLSANHACLISPPIVVAHGLALLVDIALCLSSCFSSNQASPVLTNALAQFFRRGPVAVWRSAHLIWVGDFGGGGVQPAGLGYVAVAELDTVSVSCTMSLTLDRSGEDG